MKENENIITNPIEDEDETMLPDGWAEGDDIFADEEWTGEEQADESAADPEQDSEEGEVNENGDTAPTTEHDAISDDKGEAIAEAPTTEQTTEVKPNTKHKFKATFDREEREVEVDLDADLPTIWQKAQVTDRVQAKLAKMSPVMEKAERLSRSLGYDNLESMLDRAEENYRNAEVNRLKADGVNEEIARDHVARKMAAAAEYKPESEAVRPESSAAPNGRNFTAEIGMLFQARPDLAGKKLPPEVIQAAKDGKHLLAAYTDYEVQQAKAEAAKIRKENEIYKQNAASAAKAPVKGVSGGGATDTKAKDPFEEGFDSDDY
jgi:hypothetical protein